MVNFYGKIGKSGILITSMLNLTENLKWFSGILTVVLHAQRQAQYSTICISMFSTALLLFKKGLLAAERLMS